MSRMTLKLDGTTVYFEQDEATWSIINRVDADLERRRGSILSHSEVDRLQTLIVEARKAGQLEDPQEP